MTRTLHTLLILLLSLFVLTSSALAACPPDTPADHLAAAAVVGYGRVGRIEPIAGGTRYFVVLSEVYKGSPPNPVKLFIPEGGLKPLEAEDEITLYLLLTESGSYMTDACVGTHPGTPTADEAAVLGAGVPAPRIGLPERSWIPFTAMGITVVAFGLVLLSIWRRRRDEG